MIVMGTRQMGQWVTGILICSILRSPMVGVNNPRERLYERGNPELLCTFDYFYRVHIWYD